MKRLRLGFWLVCCVLWLAALASCSCEREGVVVSLSRDEIQERINTRFPIQQNLLLIAIVLRDPKVILNEGSDRIGSEVAVDITVPGLPKFTGGVTVSGVPFYDANKKAFFLSDPTVDRLTLPGLPTQYEPQVRQAIDAALKPALREFPVYELKDRNAKEVTAAYALREVRVKDGKLEAVLGLPK